MEAIDQNSLTKQEEFSISPVVAWEIKKVDWDSYFTPSEIYFRRAAANLIDYAIIGLIISPIYFYIDHLFHFLTGGTYGFFSSSRKI